MIAAGASVRDKDVKAKTVLHYCRAGPDPNVVKMLHDAGADAWNSNFDPACLAEQKEGEA